MKPRVRQLAAVRAFWVTIAFVPTAASEPKLPDVAITDQSENAVPQIPSLAK
jgi:hypothetical protein